MHRGQWTKAKPHAVAAGETWSAWGLSAASIICEGLAEWEESEAWIREMSQNYPSTSGAQWYFWCCRTGRGDKAAAARLAERFFATVAVQPTRENQIMRGAYYLLEGHAGQALDSYRQAASFRPTFTCTYMIADLSRELGDDNGRLEVLNGFAPALEQWKAQDPQYDTYADAAGLAILELIKTGDASDNRLADIEKLLVELAPNTRGAFAYFVAKELEFLGKEKEAEKYWRRALTIPASDPNYATLAGKELADRHGTSRTDDDALDESDLWPPLAEADK
jgi:tetratricopeptide (TPR) repeat protein